MLYEKVALPDRSISYLTLPPPEKLQNKCYDDYSDMPDNLLWEAFRNGEELAFTHIYKNYSGMLYEYGCKYSPDKEMVRDCLHDFFLYLRKNRLGFSDTS